jgi:hypothetical protein
MVRYRTPNQSKATSKWRIAARTTSAGDCASLSTAVGDSCGSSPPSAAPDSPRSSVLESCTTATASRVIGLPRARELPPRTIRTFSVGRRVSSSNSWDADAELTSDRRSMSSEGWGERVWRRLILGCLLLLVVRLNGKGAVTLTILLYHSKPRRNEKGGEKKGWDEVRIYLPLFGTDDHTETFFHALLVYDNVSRCWP